MSRSTNTTCSVCHRILAKWLCRCGNEAICQEGSCLAVHMTKANRSHLLVEYDLGIELHERETEGYMKSVDTALEVVDFVKAEGERLKRERDTFAEEIDRRVENYVNQIRSYGAQKKRKLDTMFETSINSLEFFKTPEKRKEVIEMKQKGKPLASITCDFQELETETLIELKGSERTYQLATKSGDIWEFCGAFDAISFTTSKYISLTGVSLTKGVKERELVLHSLEILKGNTTTSEVLYTHTEKRCMDSQHPFMADVWLKKAVSIAPNTFYTIKVLLLGCSGMYSSSLQTNEQEGLVVTTSRTVFNGKEATNGSDPISGAFYALHYYG